LKGDHLRIISAKFGWDWLNSFCTLQYMGTPGMTFYPNTPKYTQIHHKIILFLLFWDVLWITNDLLAPLSLFFHEFQQNSQVFTDPTSLTITNITKYTLKFRLSKVWYM
jgi:hypothetical protein